jgi:hypothetical protein
MLTGPSRRLTVANVAVAVGLILQVLNQLDVFDGATTWVWIALFTAYTLILAIVLAVAGLNIRDTRARRKR